MPGDFVVRPWHRQAVEQQVGEMAIGLGVGESGGGGQLALLDAHGRRADDVADEPGVHRPELPRRDARVHQLGHPLGRCPRVVRIHLRRGREPGHVGEELGRGRGELGRHRLQVGRNLRGRARHVRHRRFHALRRSAEEVHDSRPDQLFFAPGQRVERALGAAEPCGEVVECQRAEALGQQERDKVVEQLGPTGKDARHLASLAGVVYPQRYSRTSFSTVWERR